MPSNILAIRSIFICHSNDTLEHECILLKESAQLQEPTIKGKNTYK